MTLVEHYFRHEYGRLVAQLARKVGVHQLELVEDAVQAALAAALDAWPAKGTPDDPGAWLYRVASNHVVGALRLEANRARLLAGEVAEPRDEDESRFASEIADDLLRMLFTCCDDAIPRESRLVLALKTLCGFSTAEIAHRLFTTEANIHKRLQRARATLRDRGLGAPSSERRSSVLEVIYLLFNEGYLSLQEAAIRRELCDEAIRLATLLADHPIGAVPETFALLALMHLHAARFEARLDGVALVLLEDQDRDHWDRAQLERGAAWLARSAAGDQFSRYHAEAGIAAEHCFAPSFRETRWHEIAELYTMLDGVAPSPLHTLNRAIAVAEWQGPEAALAELDAMQPPGWLDRSYLWDAVLADLCRRAGRPFEEHQRRALAGAPTEAVRALLRRRFGQ